MLETGDWLTPQFDYGVPFWGKPPLSTWLAAAAMATFGVDEFAARMPSLLLTVGCGALVGMLALRAAAAIARSGRSRSSRRPASSFVAAGAVMTDAALMFGTTLSMVGFWLAVRGRDACGARRRDVFFVGLAIGLLAKGPVAVVLTFLPIGAWMLWTRPLARCLDAAAVAQRACC